MNWVKEIQDESRSVLFERSSMDSNRQAEVFRALVKDQLRNKGIRFEKNEMLRDLGREEKEFNDRHQLSSPLSKVEFLELYVELMGELASEHFRMIDKEITRLKTS